MGLHDTPTNAWPTSTRAAPKGYVLLVDDEPPITRLFTKVLSSAGYAVRSAQDGATAERLLDEASFDVIVSDISMPGMDGLALLRAVRKRDLDVPFILITGTPSLETAIKAVEDGALRYLVKPIDMQVLRQVVDHASNLHQMARLKRQALAHLGHLDRQVGDRIGLDVRFTRALTALRVVYQPIVRWSSREIVAYEALVRSDEPTLPDPGALLTAGERLGRLHELGREIRALVAASGENARQRDVQIFVNLHPDDLLDEALFSRAAPLSKFADRVTLELTERAPLDGVPDVPGRIAALRALGFRIAIDDLGAGYAGLTSFAQLAPDVVKLDMSLVRDVYRDEVKPRLIRSFTALCKEMGISTVAEGVESVEERETLAELGCDLLQGYLFAKPGRGFPSVSW